MYLIGTQKWVTEVLVPSSWVRYANSPFKGILSPHPLITLLIDHPPHWSSCQVHIPLNQLVSLHAERRWLFGEGENIQGVGDAEAPGGKRGQGRVQQLWVGRGELVGKRLAK